MEEVYSSECGVVLRSGCAVRIEYVPEPDVHTAYAILTGGIAQRAGGAIVVEFDQTVPSRGNPAIRRKTMLVADGNRPGLLALAEFALSQMEDC